MTTRHDSLALGEYFHIYNRGVDKRIIFKDDTDRDRFIELLYLANTKCPVNIRNIRRDYSSIFDFDREDVLVYIGAYCLMLNHFHILLTPVVESGVQIFMQKLLTGYSMYFNKKYERSGALFEGRFKSKHVSSDEYLKYLFAYIHLNPVKLIQPDWKDVGIQDIAEVKKYLDEYPYSSLRDYFGNREESKILDKDKFPEYFSTKQEIDTELLEWLNYSELEPAKVWPLRR